jgi:MoaA/NifB/PqqE/SkfB family radical SAM enzyme
LLRNGLRYRRLRRTGAFCLPQALSLEVTRRCVARCRMCNIWRTPEGVRDLPLERWVALLASPALADLRELDLTGGEPFLRGDLTELVRRVAELAPGRFPRLRTVAITTNGFLPDRVLAGAQRMAGFLGGQGVDLVFACGCDGVGSLHDEVRGFPGGWGRLVETLDGLATLRESHPNVVLGLKVTVGPWNVDHLDGLAEFAEARGLFSIFSPCIVTANRYGNVDRGAELRLTAEQTARFLAFLEGPHGGWDYHRRALAGFLRTGRMRKPCSAGFNYVFVRSNGEVFPCPLIPEAIGNVAESPLEEILASPALAPFRRRVGSDPACRVCTEPGLERFALPFEGFSYLGERFRRGAGEFCDIHEHLGLDKYDP